MKNVYDPVLLAERILRYYEDEDWQDFASEYPCYSKSNKKYLATLKIIGLMSNRATYNGKEEKIKIIEEFLLRNKYKSLLDKK